MSNFSPRIAETTVTRRQFTFAAALASAGMLLPGSRQLLFAKEQDLSNVDLPTLDVTVTSSGYKGIPDSLEAGRYLVTVTATKDVGDFGGGIAFIQPAGMTGDEFIAMLGEMTGPPDASGTDSTAATPMDAPGTEASPAADAGASMGPPPIFYESLLAGGTTAGPGESSQVVVDLPPGSWVAWGDDPSAPQKPVAFEVTGEMPTDLVEPESTVTLVMGEYEFQVSEGELTTGSYVVKIENQGGQPHFVAWLQVPDGTTKDQIQEVLDLETQAMMTGTPPVYGDFNPEVDTTDVAFSGTQSSGTTQWIEVADVKAGTHVLICFFPDISDGMPHANHGMYTIVEISE